MNTSAKYVCHNCKKVFSTNFDLKSCPYCKSILIVKKRSKPRINIPFEICKQNHKHRSPSEAEECNTLHIKKKAGIIKDVEREVPFEFRHNNIFIGKHKMDFIITHNDNSKEAKEIKGYVTDLWRWKSRMFRAYYPQYKYTIIYIRKDRSYGKNMFNRNRKKRGSYN